MFNAKTKDFECKDWTYIECCNIDLALQLISGKWKGMILYALSQKECRFNELQRLIPKISHHILTVQLQELENFHIIQRTEYITKPPKKVVYSLTDLGLDLIPIIQLLNQFGEKYLTIETNQTFQSKVEITKSKELIDKI